MSFRWTLCRPLETLPLALAERSAAPTPSALRELKAEGTAEMPDDDTDAVIGQRVFGCELVQQMGILLRMPQVVTSTAQVMFHRFYAKRSLYKFDARVSWASNRP